MGPDEHFISIADSGKPNAGRIYDYALGGNHNFEVDREAAQQVLKLAPDFPKIVRLIRWFLGEAVRRLLADGYTQFIDFASGLPTVDHIHQVSPPGTRVIYSDLDPITVAYGRELVKDNPEVHYFHCDAGKPEELLQDEAAHRYIDKERRTAIGMNGIAWFLTDDELGHSLRVLYDWAPKGARLFISDSDSDPKKQSPALKEGSKLYNSFHQPFYSRTRATLMELASPWKLRHPGFLPLEDWVSMRAGVGDYTKGTFGVNKFGLLVV